MSSLIGFIILLINVKKNHEIDGAQQKEEINVAKVEVEEELIVEV